MIHSLSDVEYLSEQGKYKYSVFILTGLIDEDQTCLKALMLRCKCYFYLEYYAESIEDAKKILSIDKTLENAYIYLTKCFIALTDLENAVETLNNLLQIDPENSYAIYELEQLHILSENFKQAVEAKNDGKYKEALKYTDKCLQNNSYRIGFKLFKAECMIYLMEYSSVLEILNEVLLKNKNNPQAIYLQALNLIYQGKFSMGIRKLKEILHVYREAKIAHDKYTSIVETLGNAAKHINSHNYENAKLEYEKVLLLIEKNNSCPLKNIHLKLAEINLNLNLYEESIEQCLEVLQIEPNNLNALKTRAKCNIQLKDYEDALEDMTTVITLEANPTNKKLMKSIEHELRREKTDHFEILGVPQNSNILVVKKRYHKLALQYHPDKHRDKHIYFITKNEKKFSKINEAYQAITSNNNH